MRKNKIIQNELEALSPIVGNIPFVYTYTLTELYFEEFNTELLFNLKYKTAAFSIKNKDVPTDYFNKLPEKLLQRINDENLNVPFSENSAMLKDLRYLKTYSTPAGYFEELPENILTALSDTKKITETTSRNFLFRYLLAAVIIGILGFSLIKIFTNKSENESTQLPSTAVLEEAGRILNKGDFDTQMNTISENDIVSYLAINGQDVNAALVASLSDETNLPAEEDYFVEEDALTNFLNSLNIKPIASHKN